MYHLSGTCGRSSSRESCDECSDRWQETVLGLQVNTITSRCTSQERVSRVGKRTVRVWRRQVTFLHELSCEVGLLLAVRTARGLQQLVDVEGRNCENSFIAQ